MFMGALDEYARGLVDSARVFGWDTWKDLGKAVADAYNDEGRYWGTLFNRKEKPAGNLTRSLFGDMVADQLAVNKLRREDSSQTQVYYGHSGRN